MMARGTKSSQQSRIPAGRVERLARFGWLAGELALGSIAEGVRRFTGTTDAVGSLVLTEANAQRLAKRLASMRGAAMKLGQLLSLEGDDLLPRAVSDALSILRADANAMPQAQLRRVLGHAYGKGWEQRFQQFDMNPMAAASIGQVHAATAADGRRLALKIQYPGVAHSIESDVDNLAGLLRLARLLPGEVDLSGILAEAKRQLRLETDYHAEARQLRRYRALVADEPELVVPLVHDDLTTAHILAMDYLDGRPLEWLCTNAASQRVRDRVGAHLYRLLFRELFEFRFIQSDPNFANFLFVPESGQIGLLDFGAAREIPAALSARYARIFRAGAEGHHAALREVMGEVGFFAADERRDRIDALVDLFLLGCEPFRHRGAYDFAASDIPPRARQAGTDLTVRKGFWRPPPPETMFLHRKLGGVFLLCARLRARVDVRTLLLSILDRAADR